MSFNIILEFIRVKKIVQLVKCLDIKPLKFCVLLVSCLSRTKQDRAGQSRTKSCPAEAGQKAGQIPSTDYNRFMCCT